MSEVRVVERLAAVRERIGAAAARAGRPAGSITLVGVAKRQPVARLAAAVRAGLRHLGENYVQEAAAHLRELRALLEGSGLEAPCWHLIGRLQRNKAGAAVELFDAVETLDRAALGDALEARAARAGRRLELLVQVNLSGEPQKGGIAPEGLGELLAHGDGWPHLRLAGLMTVPREDPDPEKARPAFAQLRDLLERARRWEGGSELRELSMGMSHDFEVAIEEGATRVRVGTAIFGSRNP